MIRMTTVERIKTLLGLGDNDTGQDDIIDVMVQQVSSEVGIYLNRIVEIPTIATSEYFDVEKGNWIYQLEAFPIIAMTDVRSDLDNIFGTDTIIDSTNYSVNNRSGTIKFKHTVLDIGPQALKITYRGGMASTSDAFITSYPQIQAAVDVEVAGRFQRKNTIGLIAITQQGGSATVAVRKQFFPTVEEMLYSSGEMRY